MGRMKEQEFSLDTKSFYEELNKSIGIAKSTFNKAIPRLAEAKIIDIEKRGGGQRNPVKNFFRPQDVQVLVKYFSQKKRGMSLAEIKNHVGKPRLKRSKIKIYEEAIGDLVHLLDKTNGSIVKPNKKLHRDLLIHFDDLALLSLSDSINSMIRKRGEK